MDSVTQITLGAAVGEAVLGKKIGNKALIWGGLAGLIPDLDVIPSQFMNDVNSVDFHRGISHSVVFCLALTPLLTWTARKIHHSFQSVQKWEWNLMFFLGLFTHALLDCFTTWGTQLFWPLDYRVAFQSVFVIDPLYTIPLLAGVIAAALTRKNLRKRLRLNRIGLIISCSYLALTLVNKQYVNNSFHQSLNEQGIEYTELDTRPTPFNNLLWSANVKTKDGFYTGYYSLPDEKWPVTFQFYPNNHHLLADSLRNEPIVQKLLKITQGNYILEKQGNGNLLLHDLRFGQLAGWLDKNKYPEATSFVFSYMIKPKLVLNSKKPGIYRHEPDFSAVSGILGKFWDRVKGLRND